jgi:hypothetical protein
LLTEKFDKSAFYDSPESKARIENFGRKNITFLSKGLRTANNATTATDIAAERWLGRYRFGAEFINGINMMYGEGYPIEIGDIVLVDFEDLQLTDFNTGNRQGGFKYMEVMNKSLNNKTGDVIIDLTNTAFELTDRYGTVSPASKIDTGATNIRLPLKRSYGTKFFERETYKWEDYVGEKVLVHDPEWTVQAETTIKTLSNNPSVLIVDPALPWVPAEDYIVDIPNYPTSTDVNELALYKTMHAFFSPNVDIVSSASSTTFVVGAGDIAKFLVGAIVRINNFDYSEYSDEKEVTNVDTGTNTVTVDSAVTFTMNSTHEVKLIGFADGGYSYRIV